MDRFVVLTGAVNGEKVRIKSTAIISVEDAPSKDRTLICTNETDKSVAVKESSELILSAIGAQLIDVTATAENSTTADDNQKSPTDMFGKEIKEGEAYFMIGNKIVHVDSIEDYFIEELGATVHERKKSLTAGTVNDQNKSHQ